MYFYALPAELPPTVVNLLPALVAADDVFFAPTAAAGAVSVTAPLVPRDDAFLSPSISVGPVNVTPSLIAADDVFFSVAISIPGSVSVAASYFVDAESFFAPVAARGVAGLANVAAAYVVDAETFYAPTVGYGTIAATAPFVAADDVFLPPAVSVAGVVNVAAPLVVAPDVFYAPSVTIGAVIIVAPLVAADDTIFSPFVSSIVAGRIQAQEAQDLSTFVLSMLLGGALAAIERPDGALFVVEQYIPVPVSHVDTGIELPRSVVERILAWRDPRPTFYAFRSPALVSVESQSIVAPRRIGIGTATAAIFTPQWQVNRKPITEFPTVPVIEAYREDVQQFVGRRSQRVVVQRLGVA